MSFTKEQVEEMQRRVESNRAPMSIEEFTRRMKAGIPVPLPDIPMVGVKAKANLTPRRSTMNKGEAQYAQVLEAEKRAGRITDYRFEGVKLRLADNTHLTMDFLVIDCDGFVQLHDVKALWSHGKVGVQEDANIKIKVAASQYPYFQFLTAWKEKNGTWSKKTY